MEAGWRNKPLSGIKCFLSHSPRSSQQLWKQCQRLPISFKSKLNRNNNMSLKFTFKKVNLWCSNELNRARCKDFWRFYETHLLKSQHPRDGSRGRVQGVGTLPGEMTCGFLIQLVFCITICLHYQSVVSFLSGATPPKEKPGSAPSSCQKI